MTSCAPVSGPFYILWKHRSTWKASLWVPDTSPVQEQWPPAGQTPLLCLGLAELLPTSMVPETYQLRPGGSGHYLTLPQGKTVRAIPSNKALCLGWKSASLTGRALTTRSMLFLSR